MQMIFRTLLNDIKKYNVDMVSCDYFSVRDQRNPGFPKKLNAILDENGISKYIYYMFSNEDSDVIWGTVWRSIFKKKIIMEYNIKFNDNLSFSEDLVFVLTYLLYTKSIFIERDILYIYNDTNDSLMHSVQKYKKNLFNERLILIDKLQDCLNKLGLISKYNDILNNIFQEYILECIGNACIKEETNNFFNAYTNVMNILKHPKTIEIFSNINTPIKKRKIIFNLIKRKRMFLITFYYYTKGRRKL